MNNEALFESRTMQRLKRGKGDAHTAAKSGRRAEGHIVPPVTSRCRVFATLQEAEIAVEWARVGGYPTAGVANGFDRRPVGECLLLYTRLDSHPEGKTIVVYAYTGVGLVYLRENGKFQ